MVVEGNRAVFWEGDAFRPMLVLRVALCPTLALRVSSCPTVVLRVAACPTVVLRVAACPTVVVRLSYVAPLAHDVVLRVAALSQTWLARVAARAASASRCLADQFCLPCLPCHRLALCKFNIVVC